MIKEAVVMIILSQDGKRVVLGKKSFQGDKPLAGLWHLPGETKKPGENDFDAINRSAKEELGIMVNGYILLALNSPFPDTKAAWYEVMVCGPKTLKPGSDLDKAKWVKIEEVKSAVSSKVRDLWPERVQKYFGIS